LPHVAHVRAHAVAVRPVEQEVEAEGEGGAGLPPRSFAIPYDFLALGVGARCATFGVPGVEEHAFFLKELADARAIRARILCNVAAATLPDLPLEEKQCLLSFVIVGGGPTGIEFAAELADFISADALRLHPELREHVRVSVLEAGPEVLTSFDASLRGHAASVLRDARVVVRTGARVAGVGPREVRLADGAALPCGLCVWNTGLAPQPLVRSLTASFARDKWGHLLVDAGLRALGADAQPQRRVFAMGDAASVAPAPFAPTAQVAEQQGFYLAAAMNAAGAAAGARGGGGEGGAHAAAQRVQEQLDAGAGGAFAYKHAGSLAALGMLNGLADFTKVRAGSGAPTAPLAGAKISGAAANVVWKAKLGTLKNRLQVPADWLKSSLLGRDTTIF
jgi:NADH:ubiquinone reductase (non-electrogenic)